MEVSDGPGHCQYGSDDYTEVRLQIPEACRSKLPLVHCQYAAEQWIATHTQAFESRTSITYAIALAGGGLVGAISLERISVKHSRAELGYWIGCPFWGQGMCSEAAKVLIQYANTELGLTRFDGRCLARNLGSARVMEKVGFLREGRLAKHVYHRGRYEDILVYGLVLLGRNNVQE